MLNLTIRRASSRRWFALRCSLEASDTPVTVGMEVRARRPIMLLVGYALDVSGGLDEGVNLSW
jgi:hypothetical protein